MEQVQFKDLGLNEALLEGIEAIGFSTPTPIQAQAIPVVVAGKDLIACAQTGTGKTAAYVIPLIHRIMQDPSESVQALILSPTRELAQQIDQQIEGLGYFTNVASVPIYGGSSKNDFDYQMAAIRRGVEIVVATPGRLLQHSSLGHFDFKKIRYFVLDEADKMLDMGFMPDIMRIVKELSDTRQTLMFSATMAPKIREFARKILKNPEEITLKVSKPAERVTQEIYVLHDSQKIAVLEHIVKQQAVEGMVVFASSKISADAIHRQLKKLDYKVDVIHSDRTQEERLDILRKFKNKEVNILVATDILSRGIDIDNLSHVLNFDVPRDSEDYVHRIGRTARAENTGTAITFVGEKDQFRFGKIERFLGETLPKMEIPAELGECPAYEPFAKKNREFVKPSGGNRNGSKPFNSRSHSNRDNSAPRKEFSKPKPQNQAPRLDENGNPIARKPQPQQAPRLDENGNPLPPKKKKRNFKGGADIFRPNQDKPSGGELS